MLNLVLIIILFIRNPYIYYSKFAKGRFPVNPIKKKFENMYLIIGSSDLNQFSAFNCSLNEEHFKLKNKFSNFLVKGAFLTKKSQFF